MKTYLPLLMALLFLTGGTQLLALVANEYQKATPLTSNKALKKSAAFQTSAELSMEMEAKQKLKFLRSNAPKIQSAARHHPQKTSQETIALPSISPKQINIDITMQMNPTLFNGQVYPTNCPDGQTVSTFCPDGEIEPTSCGGIIVSTSCPNSSQATICSHITLPTNCPPDVEEPTYCTETWVIPSLCPESGWFPTECPDEILETHCDIDGRFQPTVCYDEDTGEELYYSTYCAYEDLATHCPDFVAVSTICPYWEFEPTFCAYEGIETPSHCPDEIIPTTCIDDGSLASTYCEIEDWVIATTCPDGEVVPTLCPPIGLIEPTVCPDGLSVGCE